ncbi:MAG: hypothetical protein AAGF01_28895 [Cyanobacteria bacterium P01_G01_bin.38]
MNALLDESLGSPGAPIVVLFGGNPQRRHEVIEQLQYLGDITIYGTLSEAEGIAKLEELGDRVDLVLIGGRYTSEQRQRIQAWIAKHLPQTKITQPGHDYPYSNEAIVADVAKQLKISAQ